MGSFKKFYNNLLKEREEGKPYDFASSQIDLLPDLSQQIYDWCVANIPESDLGKNGRQNLFTNHITLLWGLESDYFESLEPLVQCFRPFTVKLGKMSLFNAPDEDVLKFEILDSEPLFRINQFFKNNLKYVETHPNYTPHSTISYNMKGSVDKFIGNSSFEGIEVPVNGITFSSKLGEKTYIPFIPETYSPPIGRFDVRYRS